MPLMFISSSTFLKPPFFSRCSMIRRAVAAPTPGSACRSAAVAVLRLTGVVTAGAGLGLAAFSCAVAIPGALTTSAARTHARAKDMRYIDPPVEAVRPETVM